MKRFLALIAGGLLLASSASAAVYDLKIDQGDIVLEPTHPIAKQPVRVYATVQNVGERDAEAMIEFFDGDKKIGSKFVSVRANGRPDEVWIEWTPMSESDHVLRVALMSDVDTPDEDMTNGSVSLEVYSDSDTDQDGVANRVDQDDDNDGTLDTQDQFPLDQTRQTDTDGDGIDDARDTDIDNDGLLNVEEQQLGTDRYRRDTDGDGINDKEDVYPLDSKRWKREEVAKPAVVVVPKATVVSKAPPLVAQIVPRTISVLAPTPTPAPAVSPPLDPVQPLTTTTLEELGIHIVGGSTSSLEPSDVLVPVVPDAVSSSVVSETGDGHVLSVLAGLAAITGILGAGFLIKSKRG